MRIFLAGASGSLGRRLVPTLVTEGHDVIGTTRSESKAAQLEAAGAKPLVVDGLDREGTLRAVTTAQPDVVIHQLTALSDGINFKKFDESFATTNELRTKGLDYLLEGAREAGAKRFIVQSYTGWPNARTGSEVKTEDDPLDTDPAPETRQSIAAIKYLESVVTEASDIEGLALRYGGFYGPGDAMLEMVAKRKLPIVGSGSGVWSFIHFDDAASATAAAVDHGEPGIYNIVDDEPAPVASWLPYLADAIGAKPPRRLPAWLAKPLIGQAGLNAMTANRGSSNAKVKRELGWTLKYPSWRDGFRALAG